MTNRVGVGTFFFFFKPLSNVWQTVWDNSISKQGESMSPLSTAALTIVVAALFILSLRLGVTGPGLLILFGVAAWLFYRTGYLQGRGDDRRDDDPPPPPGDSSRGNPFG